MGQYSSSNRYDAQSGMLTPTDDQQTSKDTLWAIGLNPRFQTLVTLDESLIQFVNPFLGSQSLLTFNAYRFQKCDQVSGPNRLPLESAVSIPLEKSPQMATIYSPLSTINISINTIKHNQIIISRTSQANFRENVPIRCGTTRGHRAVNIFFSVHIMVLISVKHVGN